MCIVVLLKSDGLRQTPLPKKEWHGELEKTIKKQKKKLKLCLRKYVCVIISAWNCPDTHTTDEKPVWFLRVFIDKDT